MITQLSAPIDENRIILAAIAERERLLAAREKELLGALRDIETERRALADDRRAIEHAASIKARILAGRPVVRTSAPHQTQGVELDLRPREGERIARARARIGDKRYNVLASLRDCGPLSLSQIVAKTGQAAGRVKEQLQSDMSLFVDRATVTIDNRLQIKFQMTPAGLELLDRFEAYRLSQGKSLPSRSDDSGADPTPP